MMLFPSAIAVAEPRLSSAAQASASSSRRSAALSPVGDTERLRLLRRHLAAGEDQFLGTRQADAARREVHAAAVGNQAAVDVGWGEQRPPPRR